MIKLSWMKPSAKQIQETIEEIHNSFEIASDLALKEAKEILNKPLMSNEQKVQKMVNLGFTAAKGVEKYQEEKKEKSLKEEEVKLINEWSQKYPQYKFILERQVSDICNKYNLVCGESNLYKGDIPMKNLLEIEAFKIRDKDESYAEGSFWNKSGRVVSKEFLTSDEDFYEMSHDGSFHHRYSSISFGFYPVSFQICAPISDMNTRGMKLEGHKLVREIPDPIVLYPVSGGYLVVSKWGLEGDDPMLTNEKMN